MLEAMAKAYEVEPDSLREAALEVMAHIKEDELHHNDVLRVMISASQGAYGPSPDFLIPYLDKLAAGEAQDVE